MYILGISCSNDGTASLVRDGDIIAAVAEERLSRVKMHLGFPRRAIQECLRIGGIDAGAVDVVALSFKDYLRAHPFYTNALMAPKGCPDIENEMSVMMLMGELARQVASGEPVTFSARKFSEKNSRTTAKIYAKALRDLGLEIARFVTVDHHLAHAASAYYTSGLADCLIVTADGYGDNYSTTISTGRDGRITRIGGTPYTDSPGVFYTAVTKFLGFRSHRHEGKITGLAAYGDPRVCYGVMEKSLFVDGDRFHAPCLSPGSLNKGKLALRLLWGDFFRHPQMTCTIDYFRKELRSAKPENVAAAAQKRLEDCFVQYIGEAVRRTGLGSVAMAGGVFGNVKLNQRIAEIPEVTNVFIHPDMGDGGTAVGSAFVVWAEEALKHGKVFMGKRLEDVYFGPEFGDGEIESVLRRYGLEFGYHREVEPVIARLMADGKIIGRFNGKCEYGPRALGNRSIIADPTDKTINDWLNKRLHRTFRPKCA
jgi:carbamoyltransferase